MPDSKEVKAGYKTTEFWLSMIAIVVGQLYAAGIVGEGTTIAKVIALVASILTALGYTVMRTKAKG